MLLIFFTIVHDQQLKKINIKSYNSKKNHILKNIGKKSVSVRNRFFFSLPLLNMCI